MKTVSYKHACGTCEAELDQFSIFGTKMFQMVLIHRRSYLAGFWGSVGLVDEWALETSGMPISVERGAQENGPREDCWRANNKAHGLLCSRGIFR